MAGPGKKRYQVTLTQNTVDRFQKVAESLKLPQGVMSLIIDESLEKTTGLMEKLHEKGTSTFADLLQLVGQSMDDEMQKEVDHDQKANEAGKKKEGERKAPRR